MRRERGPMAVSWICAVFMLCVLPLLFHNAFFDINRVKVGAVCTVVPLLTALGIAAYFACPRQERPRRCRGADAPCLWLLLLLGACLLSCALAGFAPAVLTGSEGRYCGLWFWLACGAAFGLIAAGCLRGETLAALGVAAACLVALLGIANAQGIDLLGFYRRIQAGQEQSFLSTIGNIDFFGAYLALLLPLAAARFIMGGRGGRTWATGGAAVLLLLGIAASRTDVAFLAGQIALLALLALSGGTMAQIGRVLLLGGAGFLALPLMQGLLARGAFALTYSGLLAVLCDTRAALAVGSLLLVLGVACLAAARRGVRAPGTGVTLRMSAALFLIALLVLAGSIAWFTLVRPDAQLGAAQSLLRFDDAWGSRRGFVYTRALRAFAEFTLPEKLFGKGLDRTRAILTPYFDNAAMLQYGTFNDAHCQPLQLLLTCGLFGMAAFVALYVSTAVAVFHRAQGDTLLCGLFASLCAYLPIMLLCVTQPILIAVYLSLCALAVSRLRALLSERGTLREP